MDDKYFTPIDHVPKALFYVINLFNKYNSVKTTRTWGKNNNVSEKIHLVFSIGARSMGFIYFFIYTNVFITF